MNNLHFNTWVLNLVNLWNPFKGSLGFIIQMIENRSITLQPCGYINIFNIKPCSNFNRNGWKVHKTQKFLKSWIKTQYKVTQGIHANFFIYKCFFEGNTLWPEQKGGHFTDKMWQNLFKRCCSIQIALKFVPGGRLNVSLLVHVMAWQWSVGRLVPEPMMT